MNIHFEDWGTIDYGQALRQQQEIFDKIVAQKSDFSNLSAYIPYQRFVVCEHPHVYTLGKHGQQQNMLISEDFLKKINATYYQIDRGGDITYHGPGQIVGYPILDIEALQLSLKEYIYNIEEAIILTLQTYGITSSRLQGATGVWLDVGGKDTRKICAIGVRSSRYITMHGFALNVNTDLKYFSYINPCGFIDKGVTSMEKELHQKQEISIIKSQIYKNFCKLVL